MELAGQESTPVVVDVSCPSGCALSFEWGRGAEIETFTLQPPGFSGQQTVSNRIRWGIPDKEGRNMLVKHSQLYSRMKQSMSPGAPKPNYRLVEAFIGECLAHAKADLASSEEEETGPSYAAKLGVATWELLKTIYVIPFNSSGLFPYHLNAWFAEHYMLLGGKPPGEELGEWSACYMEAVVKSLESTEAIEDHPEYWPCLLRLIALGWWAEAKRLIRRHSVWDTAIEEQTEISCIEGEVLETLVDLMISRPSLSGCALLFDEAESLEAATFEKFRLKLTKWTKDVELRLEHSLPNWCEHLPAAAPNLQLFLELLCGKDAALRTCTASWLEYVIASLFHRYPLFDVEGLRGVVDASHIQSSIRGRWENAPFLEALFKFVGSDHGDNALDVVLHPDSPLYPWARVHLTCLLELLMRHRRDIGGLIIGLPKPEHYCLEFVASLCPSTVVDGTALDYLTYCRVAGKRAAEKIMDSATVNVGDPDIPSAVSICERLGLQWSRHNLCTSLGVKQVIEGFYGSGLRWLLMGNDQKLAGFVLQEVTESVQAVLEEGVRHFKLCLHPIPELRLLEPFLEATARAFPEFEPASFVHCFARFQRLTAALVLEMGKSANNTSPEYLRELGLGVRDVLLELLNHQFCSGELKLSVLHRTVPLLETGLDVFSAEDVSTFLTAVPRTALCLPGKTSTIVSEENFRELRLVLQRAAARMHVAAGGVVRVR